jgi:hypothetical protein
MNSRVMAKVMAKPRDIFNKLHPNFVSTDANQSVNSEEGEMRK